MIKITQQLEENLKTAVILSLSIILSFGCLTGDCTCLYLKGLGGINKLSVKEKYLHMRSDPAGYYLGGALGCQLFDFFNYELEISYRYHPWTKVYIPHSIYSPFKKGKRYAFTTMFNVLYQYHGCWRFHPYMGFGLGYTQARGELKGDYSDSSMETFRYPIKPRNSYSAQVILGAGYPICENTEAALEGRYMHEIGTRQRFTFLKTQNYGLGLTLKRFF